jgi:YD repeat-containing protein
MPRNVVALVLALAVESAWAEPYRPLPRISPAKVRSRAAVAAAARGVLARNPAVPLVERRATASQLPVLEDAGGSAVAPAPATGPLIIEVEDSRPVPSRDSPERAAGVVSASGLPRLPSTDGPVHVVVLPSPLPSRGASGPKIVEVIPFPDDAPTVPPASAAAPPAPSPDQAPERAPALATAPARAPELGRGPAPAADGADAASPLGAVAGALSSAQLTTVSESRTEDGRTLQVMRDGSGALLEIVRDARGLLLSARDFVEP